jgi:cell division initiation protein
VLRVKLTPLDIRRQEFKKVVRGVDPEEVSVFLDMVAGEYERVLRENKTLSEELEGWRNMMG